MDNIDGLVQDCSNSIAIALELPQSCAGLEGFGQYPVFTAVFTGKYRPGKNRFWTPKVGKTQLNYLNNFIYQ